MKNFLDIDFYFQNFNKNSFLSCDEENFLIKNFKEKNDIKSAKRLIESNLSYIIKVAKNYNGYGIIIKDLIQVGIIGLFKAIKNFDYTRKIRFMSFAIYWIKSEMHDYIIKNLRIVKSISTKGQKKLFFNFKSIKKSVLLNKNEQKVIANFFNIKKKDIEQIQNNIYGKDISIDDDFFNLNLDILTSSFNFLKDPLDIIEKKNWLNYLKIVFKNVYQKLDHRSKKILFYRLFFKKKYTLKKLSKLYNVSSERIRQIEKNILNKVRMQIKSENKNINI